MARKAVVIGGSSVTLGLLRDLLTQLEKEALSGNQLRAFLEHRNPFDRQEIEKVLPFADEEVESNIGYPKGFRFRTPQEQLEVWQKHFPSLDASHVLELTSGQLPEGAKAWGVIPKPSKAAANYCEALQVMLNLIAKERKFENLREGTLTDKHLRLTERTQQVLSQLEEQTPGDFLVIAFQFGLRHRGRSVRRARVCFLDNEFGLGPYEVATLLLTHPDRINGPDQLYIDCAGIEYDPEAGDSFGSCLYFYWYDNCQCLALYCHWLDYARPFFGAVSGFRP